QTAIYYITGDDPARLEASPHLEGFRARGVEVLLLTDPIDSFWVMTGASFDGKPFKSVTQGAADLALIPLLDPDKAPAPVAGLSDAERELKEDVAHLLLDEAHVLEGDRPLDAKQFCDRLARLMRRGLAGRTQT